MKQRMGNVPWNLSEDDVARLYPELDPEQRAEAAENLSRYLRVVGEIHDKLDDEGELKDVLLRIQYEKRNRRSDASQNVKRENDDSSTPTGDSNESRS